VSRAWWPRAGGTAGLLQPCPRCGKRVFGVGNSGRCCRRARRVREAPSCSAHLLLLLDGCAMISGVPLLHKCWPRTAAAEAEAPLKTMKAKPRLEFSR
jgi:hypothetical protein